MTIIEARDLDKALELVSKFPARLTSVEVRPIMDPYRRIDGPGRPHGRGGDPAHEPAARLRSYRPERRPS